MFTAAFRSMLQKCAALLQLLLEADQTIDIELHWSAMPLRSRREG